jgi:hypothetical protein
MPLNRIAYHASFTRLGHHTSSGMASTIVGASGRVYVQGEVLRRHHQDDKLSIFKAEYV